MGAPTVTGSASGFWAWITGPSQADLHRPRRALLAIRARGFMDHRTLNDRYRPHQLEELAGNSLIREFDRDPSLEEDAPESRAQPANITVVPN
jgi:hypothetical protein